jgi:superfamily II DNA or RNA helicase
MSEIQTDNMKPVKYLGQKGYSILKNSLTAQQQQQIRKDLMMKPFMPPNSIQQAVEFPIYRESPKKIYVPRFYGFEKFGEPDEDMLPEGDDICVPFAGDLRDYQHNIINAYLKEAHDTGCGLLEIPCGRGKTVIALNIISQLGKKTLVIVHKEFLLNQWVERIEQFLPSAKIGRIQGKILDIENKDVVIGMLQSLSMKDYPSGTFDSFGLTISDECFPAGTRISTEKGFIPIDHLDKYVGQLHVTSFNHTSGLYEKKLITNWFKKGSKTCFEIYYHKTIVCDKKYSQTPNMITCSEDHRIFSFNEEKYVFAKNLNPGDIVLGLNNTLYTIYLVKPVGIIGPLYDIEVEDNHNFFACESSVWSSHPILVHNCHHISAEVFCRSLFKIVTPYMLGLSATMNRKDGLTKVFKQFLGKVVYKEERNTDDNVLVKTIQYSHTDPDFSEVEYNFKGQVHYSKMISKLCNFNHRTEFILNVISDMIKEDPKGQIIVLGHFKSILTYLYDAIEHRKIASVGYYVGGMKEKDLNISATKQIVIATFAMAEEGLDIKTLKRLILVTPKTDVTQAAGRILRMKHDRADIVDIVDQHDIFQKQYIKRRRFYTKCKYKIIQTTNKNYKKLCEDEWDIIYEPGEKSGNYKKKIAKSERPKLLQGKCFLKKPVNIDIKND